jgi:cyclin A
VSEKFRLQSDTLFLAVSYVDRYLSLLSVPRSQLQLVGVSYMWIASKYEAIFPPRVADICYITANTYYREDIISTEAKILKEHDYKLTAPTAKTFLRLLL